MFPSKHFFEDSGWCFFKKAITVSPLIKVCVSDRDVLLVYEMEAVLFSPQEALLL